MDDNISLIELRNNCTAFISTQNQNNSASENQHLQQNFNFDFDNGYFPINNFQDELPSLVPIETNRQEVEQYENFFIVPNGVVNASNYCGVESLHQTPSIDNGNGQQCEEIDFDNLISPIPPSPPLSEPEQHGLNTNNHKFVNYFNHKFVISETEDISLDKLISFNGTPPEKENRLINANKVVLTRCGESILKNSENNIPKSTVIIGGQPPSTTQTVQSQVFTPNVPNVFVVEKNGMKPIFSTSNVTSGGVYRSTIIPPIETPKPTAKKRKIADSPQKTNILILNAAPEKNGNVKSQVVESTAGSNGKTGESKPINRRLIKIPLSAFQPVDKTGNCGTGVGNAESDAAKLSNPQNLVLNIVNMVANNPEISQRTQINQRQLALNGHVVGENASTGANTGNLSLLHDKSSVVYHNRDAKTKTIYRIIYPEDLNLKKTDKPAAAATATEKTDKSKKHVNLVPRNRGRPKGLRKRVVSNPGANRVPLTQPTARTRAGRFIRPPKHVQNYYKSNSKGKGTLPDFIEPEKLNGGNFMDEENRIPEIHRPDVQFIKRERKIPSQYKCKTCNKIYLGYNRMTRHLTQYPDHGDLTHLFQMKVNSSQTFQDNLFVYLMKKIQRTSNENQTQVFFDEIKNLVHKMKELGPKLLKENCEASRDELINQEDGEVMRFLNVPKGEYVVDMSIFENDSFDLANEVVENNVPVLPEIDLPHEFTHPNHHPLEHHHNHQAHQHHSSESIMGNDRLEFNLNISLDSTEDSLLQSVDEFVKERLENLTDTSSVTNFGSVVTDRDHQIQLKDNHSQPILDLSEFLLN